MSSVSGRIPALHSDAYTALAWLCQKTTTSRLFSKTKFWKALASGSENAADPALTVFVFQVPFGFQLQSKLRLRSTSCALKRADSKIFWSFVTSATVKWLSFPVTL